MKEHIVILGMQNGDEGKAKVVDYYTNKFTNKINNNNSNEKVLVYRYQGGSNAGHTVVVDGEKFAFHLIPSGILKENTYNLLAHDVYVDARKIVNEIEKLQKKGVNIDSSNLGISGIVHMTFDYHTIEDAKNFNLKEHSSTGSGIKQTAKDKYSREGVRFVEFLDDKLLFDILEFKFRKNKKISKKEISDIVNSYAKEREILKDFLVLEEDIFNNDDFVYIIGEGAQGFNLDVNYGQYPGTTSTSPFTTIWNPTKKIGVFKAYVSSVGIKYRPFVTEIVDKELNELPKEELIEAWGEFGTTTGKPRHIGWFDVVQAKHALSHKVDEIVLTNIDKLDLLANYNIDPRICDEYILDGEIYKQWNSSFSKRNVLSQVEPHYVRIPFSNSGKIKDGVLSGNGALYLKKLEEILGKEFSLVSYGPNRKEIISRKMI